MPARKPDLKSSPARDALTLPLPSAAIASGLSEATLRRRANEGALRLVRVGRRTLVTGDSLRRMLCVEAAQ